MNLLQRPPTQSIVKLKRGVCWELHLVFIAVKIQHYTVKHLVCDHVWSAIEPRHRGWHSGPTTRCLPNDNYVPTRWMIVWVGTWYRAKLVTDRNKALSVHVALLLWACETWKVCAWISSVVSSWCRSMPTHSAAILGTWYPVDDVDVIWTELLGLEHTATSICFGWQHHCLAATQDCIRMINHTKDYILYIWYKSRGVNIN